MADARILENNRLTAYLQEVRGALQQGAHLLGEIEVAARRGDLGEFERQVATADTVEGRAYSLLDALEAVDGLEAHMAALAEQRQTLVDMVTSIRRLIGEPEPARAEPDPS